MSGTLVERFEQWWDRHASVILAALSVPMALLATLKIGDEFRRLLWDPGKAGAIDLRILHRWVAIWFSGEPLFSAHQYALYPPATYLMLWPLLGWIDVPTARWIWAILTAASLVALSLFSIRISDAKTSREKLFAVLLILSINGTGVAIGNGQLLLLILPALIGAAFMIHRDNRSVPLDVVSGSLLTWAMIKPSITLPFFWVFLFRRTHWRAGVFAIVLYGIATVVATAVQKENLAVLFGQMSNNVTTTTALFPGTRNLHGVLTALGKPEWIVWATAAVLAGSGIIIYLLRRADLWVLIGITALIARMGAYHRVYDDGLILLAELALWRAAKLGATSAIRLTAWILLAANALVMLCPARFLDYYPQYAWSAPWMWICTSVQAAIWLLSLACLIIVAQTNSSTLEHAQNKA